MKRGGGEPPDERELIRALFEKTLPLLIYASDDACSTLLRELGPFVAGLSNQKAARERLRAMDIGGLLALAQGESLPQSTRKTPTKKAAPKTERAPAPPRKRGRSLSSSSYEEGDLPQRDQPEGRAAAAWTFETVKSSCTVFMMR